MITGKEFYQVLSALVPLYAAMSLAYASVRWWHIFTPDHCAGINRFVASFALPLLSFTLVASNDIYHMNLRFLAADTLQKAAVLSFLLLAANSPLFPQRRLRRSDWVITLFSLSTLPNTLVVGVPLLSAMYGGDLASPLMVQIVVLQSGVWYTLLLVMFEYRAAVDFIAGQFPAPGSAARISSVRVDPDVVSLVSSSSAGRTVVGATASVADVDEKGNFHVVVSRMSSSSSFSSATSAGKPPNNNNNNNNGGPMMVNSSGLPRASDLTGVEIWSVRSSPRSSNLVEEENLNLNLGVINNNVNNVNYLHNGNNNNNNSRSSLQTNRSSSAAAGMAQKQPQPQLLHMFSWNGGNAAPFPGYLYRNYYNGNNDSGHTHNNKVVWSSSTHAGVVQGDHHQAYDDVSIITGERKSYAREEEEEDEEEDGDKKAPRGVMTRLVVTMVWKKLVRNPNTYASLLGIVWSLFAFRWNLELPLIVSNSVSILANTGLGMAMFSLGLFMAMQPKIIGCGKWMAVLAMGARFVLGPGMAAAAAGTIGIRGVLLQVAIVQAALPQGIVPFVFAKEYGLHPEILSTAVMFGMVLALPVTIIYYVLIGL